MTKSKSIKKNYIFNLSYQILLLIIPIITIPYVSRVLEPDGIGLYSYAGSIVTYFVLFATLGTATFGQRKISFNQNNKEEQSRTFWEIFLFRLIVSIVTLIAYLLFSYFIMSDEIVIYAILSVNILNIVLDISWFLQGIEEFGKTVSINMLIRIVSLVLIFVLVKGKEDLYIYILINASGTLLGSALTWVFLPKYLCRISGIRPFRDVKGIIKLFIPTVAIQIYTVLDKSMIGWFTTGTTENGYYEQSEKIVRMALTVVTALGTVMVPRIAKKFTDGDNEAITNYMYRSYRFVWFIGLPMMFGLIAVSSFLVPIFLGEGYDKCIALISIFSLLLIFIGLNNVTGIQYLIPTKRENIFTITVIIGAVINLLMNLLLIPRYYSIGACISSVCAEFCIAVFQFIYIFKKRLYRLKPIVASSVKYLISSVVMFVLLFVIKIWLPVMIWSLVCLILIGITIYFITLLALRDSLLFELIKKIVKIFKRQTKSQRVACELNENIEEETAENIENVDTTDITKNESSSLTDE